MMVCRMYIVYICRIESFLLRLISAGRLLPSPQGRGQEPWKYSPLRGERVASGASRVRGPCPKSPQRAIPAKAHSRSCQISTAPRQSRKWLRPVPAGTSRGVSGCKAGHEDLYSAEAKGDLEDSRLRRNT